MLNNAILRQIRKEFTDINYALERRTTEFAQAAGVGCEEPWHPQCYRIIDLLVAAQTAIDAVIDDIEAQRRTQQEQPC